MLLFSCLSPAQSFISNRIMCFAASCLIHCYDGLSQLTAANWPWTKWPPTLGLELVGDQFVHGQFAAVSCRRTLLWGAGDVDLLESRREVEDWAAGLSKWKIGIIFVIHKTIAG